VHRSSFVVEGTDTRWPVLRSTAELSLRAELDNCARRCAGERAHLAYVEVSPGVVGVVASIGQPPPFVGCAPDFERTPTVPTGDEKRVSPG